MNQHLLFKAGGQVCGVPINETDKIIALEKVTPIPDVSSYITGLQDVDGDVTAIIDLSDRFYQKPIARIEDSEVIIVNWKERKIGWLVEEVTSVQAYQTEDFIEKDSESVDGLSTTYITSFVQTQEDIIPIIDPHSLFSDEKEEEIRKLLSIAVVKE
ncbi:hypothetical protein GCM10008932_20770 [Alkalibacterium iburiense]|uniref:CheW-like domain-containing protein n=1 Tax=Alkalibacterium iburiense TaxID=290589 RepID=A0ABN0XP09_9LACT